MASATARRHPVCRAGSNSKLNGRLNRRPIHVGEHESSPDVSRSGAQPSGGVHDVMTYSNLAPLVSVLDVLRR